MNDLKRFKSHFTPSLPDVCWIWNSGTDPDGYGRLYFNGKQTSAHRISWEVHHKRKIPDGMLVCHECDNPVCVNPNHLFLGTIQDNLRDMREKGRAPKTRRTLCKDEVLQIRGYLSSGTSVVELSNLFNCSKKTIRRINQNRAYSGVL